MEVTRVLKSESYPTQAAQRLFTDQTFEVITHDP